MTTIEKILSNSSHQISPCSYAKAIEIDQALRTGTPFTALGGKRVRCRKGIVRFKLGKAMRLLYTVTETGYEAHSLVSRQRFERELKRRRAL
ncbi:ParE family toxin-like protein [Halopseudomonas sabulinigri]|uniref:ParE-like toxin domain-containing protein n=1 Tax=Halopseudomonas sabulinigri TaxID=472181 RepID=A0ABP9ZQY6_9GAMM